MQKFRLSDGRDRPDRFENRRRHLPVNAHEGDGDGTPLSFTAAQGKRGDIWASARKNRDTIAHAPASSKHCI
jgi:hypothetical protein